MWVISINGEEPITYKVALDELNQHKTPRGNSKVNISLCRRKRYQRTYIEEIHSIFDQVRPVVLHIEVHLQEQSPKEHWQSSKGSPDKITERSFICAI